jgi:hypothetical protein
MIKYSIWGMLVVIQLRIIYLPISYLQPYKFKIQNTIILHYVFNEFRQARMQKANVYRTLGTTFGKHPIGRSKKGCKVDGTGKHPLGREKKGWEDNVKMDLGETGCLDGR